MRLLPLALLAAAALLPTASSLAQTDALPTRKPGWWEIKLTVSGPTPAPQLQTVHLCTDASVDQLQSPLGVNMRGPDCMPKVARTATGWTVDGSCKVNNMTVTANAVATGDLNDHYHVDIDTHMDPPPAPQAAEVKIAMDARWLGQCPAGKKPGDAEMAANVGPGAP